MKQGKRKNRKNSCFTEIRNRDKNSSIRWMDLTRVNYKFQGARYRSGSRNRIIPLVRDKLYAKPELKYRRYEFQTGQQIPPSPAALSTRNNPTIWSVTGWRGRGRAAIFNPAIEHRGWMKIIKSCARILARARSVPFPLSPPRRLSTGRDRNFSTVLPTGFDIFGTRAASSSASGSTSKYNRANICPRREATASKTIGGSIVISASSRYTASASLLPIQLFALPTPRVGIQRINLWLLPVECLPRRASWIIITRRVSCDGSQLHSLKTTTGVNKIYLAVSARAWKSGENLQIAI